MIKACALVLLPLSAVLAGGWARAEDAPLAEYHASSGTVSPQYAWSLHLTISAAGQILLRNCQGYASDGPACKTRAAEATPAALQAILQAARDAKLAERPATKAARIMVGGGSVWGTVWLDGQALALPAQPEVADQDRVQSVLTAIAAALPAHMRPDPSQDPLPDAQP